MWDQVDGSQLGERQEDRPDHTLSAHNLPVPSSHDWGLRWLSAGSLPHRRLGMLSLGFGHKDQGSVSTSQPGPSYLDPGSPEPQPEWAPPPMRWGC